MYSICKIERTINQWEEFEGQVIFTWNIINPNGPTISCVGVRDCANEHELEVYFRWMHFFGGETYVLGYINKAEDRVEAELVEILQYAFLSGFHPAFSRFPMVSTVPSFITLADYYISHDVQKYLLTQSPAYQQEDWGRQRYYLEKYGSDFFGRAAEETRSALERAKNDPELTESGKEFIKETEISRGHLEHFQNWQPNQFESRPLNPEDAEIWWNTVTNDDFTTSCLIQIAKAWAGAIYQYQSGDPSREVAESFDMVNKFFSDNNHQLWPEEWETEKLLNSMGLKQ